MRRRAAALRSNMPTNPYRLHHTFFDLFLRPTNSDIVAPAPPNSLIGDSPGALGTLEHHAGARARCACVRSQRKKQLKPDHVEVMWYACGWPYHVQVWRPLGKCSGRTSTRGDRPLVLGGSVSARPLPPVSGWQPCGGTSPAWHPAGHGARAWHTACVHAHACAPMHPRALSCKSTAAVAAARLGRYQKGLAAMHPKYPSPPPPRTRTQTCMHPCTPHAPLKQVGSSCGGSTDQLA